MPIAALTPALATIIAGGAAAGASVYGAKKQAGAARDATRVEERYSDKAVAAAEEQRAYDREQEQLRLEREAEQKAYDRRMEQEAIGRTVEDRNYRRGQFSEYLTRLEPYRTGSHPAIGRAEQLIGANPTFARPTGEGLVTLRAPNGQTQQVPVQQAEHYERLGAVRV